MSVKTEKPSRLGADMLARLRGTQSKLDDVFGDVIGDPPPPAAPAATEMAVEAPSDSSAATDEVASAERAPLAKNEGTDEGGDGARPPRRRPRKSQLPKLEPREINGAELVRMPFNFQRDQLIELEILRTSILQRTGIRIDKSRLAREALDILFEKYKAYMP